MKHISIIGSTGSIGRQTLEVVDNLGESVRVVGISANENIDLLEAQARKYRPRYACVSNEHLAREFADRMRDTNVKIFAGERSLCQLASLPENDTVVISVVGTAGLAPTVAAIRAGKRIALANKETLVTAGSLVMALARERGAEIVPVDSEHSAVFQSIHGQNGKLRKILLTASGGPFFGRQRSELADVTPDEALNHPNWSMGNKVTIDSATMMNKGLEVLEASHLFHVPVDDIEVLVHRQSIVHSLAEFDDNAVIAQLGLPDMRLPIQYALTYPERIRMPEARLDLTALGSLTFEKPDMETFGLLSLAYEAGRTGGTLPCVMNAANEACVTAFLNGKIGFLDIEATVRKYMENHKVNLEPALEEIIALDKEIKLRLKKELK